MKMSKALKNAVKKAAKRQDKTTGFVLWEGPSPMDGSPLVCIATLDSKNDKTGNMLQTWILRADIEPHTAVKTGQDQGPCGDCKFRAGGGCYVTMHQAPLSVYSAYKRNRYPRITLEQAAAIAARREVRIGAYGDGAMVPVYVWHALTRHANGWTGYTHQFEQPWFDWDMTKYCMLSADTLAQADILAAAGHRVFLPLADDETIPDYGILCPNYSHGVQCRDCMLCNGGKIGKSIIAPIHGAKQKVFILNRVK